MKYLPVLFIVAITLKLSGCQSTDSSQIDNTEVKRIYTSNYPLYYMTERMVPPGTSVQFPVQGSEDPANWQPSTDTITNMQQADLIVINGASYEKWLLTVSLPDQKVINTTNAIQDQLLESEEVMTHSHGDEGEHEHLGTAFTTWLDLKLALLQATVIRDALIELSPTDEILIQQQYQELATELSGLDQQFTEAVFKVGQPVAYSHPVYQYFQKAYQLQGPSLHWEPHQKLTPQRLDELQHLMEHQQIAVMIWEAEPLLENVQMLQELGVESVVVNPMGNVPEQGDWLRGLNRNLEQIEGLGQH